MDGVTWELPGAWLAGVCAAQRIRPCPGAPARETWVSGLTAGRRPSFWCSPTFPSRSEGQSAPPSPAATHPDQSEHSSTSQVYLQWKRWRAPFRQFLLNRNYNRLNMASHCYKETFSEVSSIWRNPESRSLLLNGFRVNVVFLDWDSLMKTLSKSWYVSFMDDRNTRMRMLKQHIIRVQWDSAPTSDCSQHSSAPVPAWHQREGGRGYPNMVILPPICCSHHLQTIRRQQFPRACFIQRINWRAILRLFNRWLWIILCLIQ